MDEAVGIWWFYSDKVVGTWCSLSEGYDDGVHIQLPLTITHLKEWIPVITEQLPEAIDMIPKGYTSIERGRVTYNIASKVFELVCSRALASDVSAIQHIAEKFGISDSEYLVLPSSHYNCRYRA